VEPQEELAQLIRGFVAQHVRPDQVEVISHTVGLIVTRLMSDPRFFNRLMPVQELNRRMAYLANENQLLRGVVAGRQPAAPRKRAPAKKRAAPKKATQAFRSGVRGR
jgi:hypothetical protein